MKWDEEWDEEWNEKQDEEWEVYNTQYIYGLPFLSTEHNLMVSASVIGLVLFFVK